ncbi:MAG TPA: endonuclease III [Paenalcaligenes sp.]|nr:endonuclease III [Paenalcaligenes sp.]
MNAAQRNEMFARFQAANPHPTTELEYASDFQLLIAVILSAQTTDVAVNLATRKFFPDYGTPQGILDLGEEGLRECIKTIGLYRNKAKHVIRTCEILLEEHNGQVPNTRKALEALPGVGRKTANVVLNTAFGQPTIAVDTHIFRVSNRTGLAPGKNVNQVEKKLLEVIPEPYLKDAHHWLILHGRYICVARSPKCKECGISDLCQFSDKNI